MNVKVKMLLCVMAAVILGSTSASAQMQWTTVGSAGFSTASVEFPSMVFDSKDTPYIAYMDNYQGGKATVMKYNGTAWTMVGTAGFSSGVSAHYLAMAIDGNDVPYVVCQRGNYSDVKCDVFKFDGAQWVQVGSGAGFPGIGYMPEIAIDKKNNVYVYLSDFQSGNKATVWKYDGANWHIVGGAGFSATTIAMGALAIDNNDTPYVAYTEDPWGTGTMTAKKFNGTDWVTVGAAGFSAGYAFYPSMCIDKNNTPYVAYRDGANSDKATVMKFDGTAWVNVGNAGFANSSFSYGLMAVDNNGTPHVVYADMAAMDKISVMKHDGAAWVYVGGAGFSPTYAASPFLAFSKKNAPYVGFIDMGAGNDKATVMKYECPYPQSKVDICAVVTNVSHGSNVISWNNGSVQHVDSYRIYRLDNGNYKYLGSTTGNTNSFTDFTGNPDVNSMSYKLTLVDNCGRETHLDSSKAHKTMHLVFNYLLNGNASITWNSYGGVSNPVYTVLRSNNGSAFTPIAAFGIMGADTTYIDVNPPVGGNKYRIAISLPGACTNVNDITSNTVTSWNTSVGSVAEGNSISVVPNPANKVLTIASNEDVVDVEVYSVAGKRLSGEQGRGRKQTTIDISALPPGTYFLRVNGLHNVAFIKL